MSSDSNPLQLMLVADDNYRIAMLRRAICDAGLRASISRIAQTRAALAYLRGRPGSGQRQLPDLVLYDFADIDVHTLSAATAMAFGAQRSEVPVVLLTSTVSEALLDSGKLDDGAATMFAPRPLDSFLAKLASPENREFLRALRTLYQYGPILARQPGHFLKPVEAVGQISA